MLSLSEFKKLCRKGNLIALSKTIPADLETPVSCFLKLAGSKKHAFFLESAEQGEKTGRYSFIGFDPAAVFESNAQGISVTENGKTSKFPASEDLLLLMKDKMSRFKLANPQDLPAFCGGFVGYLSYENVSRFETIRLKKADGPDVPEAVFFLSKDFAVFDHFRKTLSFVILADTRNSKNPAAAYAQAEKKINERLLNLRKPLLLKAVSKKKIDTAHLKSESRL